MGDLEGETGELSSLKVVRNIPFELIPEGFVKYLRSKVYNYEQFLQVCPFYNKSGAFWNLAVLDGDAIPVCFVWGTWDPLEAHFRVVRVSSHPRLWKAGGGFMRWVFHQVKLFASEMQAERMFWESDDWRLWLKILGDLVYVDETKVVQAY